MAMNIAAMVRYVVEVLILTFLLLKKTKNKLNEKIRNGGVGWKVFFKISLKKILGRY